jgi:protoporphyrinogen/coproporphyrinogen III oxidase
LWGVAVADVRPLDIPDVVVIGGGIAGLGAALRLQDRGLRSLLLESERRVGGRLTTDRIDGFVIDRGATLLGARFSRMLALGRRLGLGPQIHRVPFSVQLSDDVGLRNYRGRRPDDFLRDRGLSRAARWAFVRVGLDMLRHWRAMPYGHVELSERLDTEDGREYLSRFGPGGEELFARVFEPSMKSPVGGSLASTSRAVMLQVMWHTFANPLWSLSGGLDRLPEAIAAQVPVRTGARVVQVRRVGDGVEIDVEAEGRAETIAARGAILAVPGHLVPALAPGLPDWIAGPLRKCGYSQIVDVFVALRRPPRTSSTAHAFACGGPEGVGILELPHVRPGRCPAGTGMVTVHLLHTRDFPCLDLHDDEVRSRAVAVVENTFPEVRGAVLFAHVVRWPIAIAQFPAGRMIEMAGLRRALSRWDAPLEFCGDYLDGPATECALITGEQAAERLIVRLTAVDKGGS